ncbi:MAG: phage tail family protein [Bacilli bacterium]|nr:phage tail family protein [Methanobrevibacter sp.]MBR1748269.1 phage tail family protein [Bacilli bacterium]
MARIISYPYNVRNVDGNTGIYREMEEIGYITNDSETFGHWGNETPGNNNQYAVAGINGAKHKPSKIEGLNFNDFNQIPDNAKIVSISVEYAYAKFAYHNTGHGSFAQPIISIPSLGLSAAGNAPPKDIVTSYVVDWYNLKNIKGSDIRDLKVTFDLPSNTSNNPAYVKMKFIRVYVEYITPNYIPTVSFGLNKVEYGEEVPVSIDVVETNNALASDDVEVSVIVTPGLSIVPGSVSGNGTFNQSNQTWYAKTVNGKARLTFKVTPTDRTVSGLNNVNAYIFMDSSTIHSSVESLYVIPLKAELVSCRVNTNEIYVSSGNDKHYSHFELTIENKARTPLEVKIDFDNLLYEGSIPGYDPETKILTITDWDGNNLYDREILLYSTSAVSSQVIVSSDAWIGVTKININTHVSNDYEEFYTEFDAPVFTRENMSGTTGEKYVFGVLCRVTGTDRLINGMKNLRASVLNNGEKFTNKLTQIGDWQLLQVEFTYTENTRLAFRFYGNYMEDDAGKIEYGNIFLIHSDYYQGYEYPVLAFQDLNLLISNSEYTNLLLEPPEQNPSTKHYFDLIDWQGLEENQYLIPHGLEITGDISSEEKVNLLLGFGHSGIDETEYYTTSVNVDNSTETFKIGGKFETLGLSFNDIQKVLKDIQFYMQVDDAFDNQTPVNVQMKNVRITLYYSLNNDCWEFFVNGVSSKHFLLDLMADSEIPRGANYDVNKFKVDGADGEYPNRINLEENEIKLRFTTCECATIDELTYLLEKVVEWLYPERDSLDNPELKTISFFYAPDRGYDYYIDETIDAEAVDGAYECEVKLIVPSGLARSLEETESAAIGAIGHMGKVKPTIFFNILSHDGEIILVESDSNQKFQLTGEFIDELPVDTEMKLDCKEKKLYYNAYGEWFLVDPNCITLDSDFFTLKNHFDFTSSVNCRVSDVKYYELRG